MALIQMTVLTITHQRVIIVNKTCIETHEGGAYFCLPSPRPSGRWDLPTSKPSNIGTEWRNGSETLATWGGRTRERKTEGQRESEQWKKCHTLQACVHF